MEGITIKVWITITATLTALIFIILNYLFPSLSVLFLSIEVILLPTVYVVGNIVTEKLIKDEYDTLIDSISEDSKKLNGRYIRLMIASYSIMTTF